MTAVKIGNRIFSWNTEFAATLYNIYMATRLLFHLYGLFVNYFLCASFVVGEGKGDLKSL